MILGPDKFYAHPRSLVPPNPRTPLAYKKVVYVCHPFSGDPEGNTARIQKLCRQLVLEEQVVPIAPQLMLPHYLDEHTEREVALEQCLQLLSVCEELYQYGEPTEGMELEIARALASGMKVIVKA